MFNLICFLSDTCGLTSFRITTLSLENHQDGVYLHRHGVTLSLQAILVCSKFTCIISQDLACYLTRCTLIACPTSWPNTLRNFVLTLTYSVKPCPCEITWKLCGCNDTHQDIFFFWGCTRNIYIEHLEVPFEYHRQWRLMNIPYGLSGPTLLQGLIYILFLTLMNITYGLSGPTLLQGLIYILFLTYLSAIPNLTPN